ncbi:MAG: hypothetical protein FWH27_00105 [Planctomycetaceae bacterium]|nr:hypothetical protein [Planctomycetaceae bacterium]
MMQLISEGKLYWWLPLVYLAIGLAVGILVANYLFRDVSWYHLITSKSLVSWTAKGEMRHNAFERYLETIVLPTLIVWVVLIYCTIRYVRGF